MTGLIKRTPYYDDNYKHPYAVLYEIDNKIIDWKTKFRIQSRTIPTMFFDTFEDAEKFILKLKNKEKFDKIKNQWYIENE